MNHWNYEYTRDMTLKVYVNVSFEDEPNEVYCALAVCDQDTKQIRTIKLLSEGYDTEYKFKPSEMRIINKVINEIR